MNKTAIMAYVAGCLFGALVMWLAMRGRPDAEGPRLNQLLQDSTAHAGWAEKRDQQRDSMNTAYRLKDDTLSWTREQLEYALHHRPASHILNDDSLLREVRRSVGDLP